ncbi:MAG: hypothetical protein OSA97_11300 [Nevskia sp.]|nr:hypothetical protein [Nevskia sp.]
MPALRDRIAEGPCLWLDYTAYAGALLANGSVPWLDTDALIGWMRKAQSLLKSDVVALPLDLVSERWLERHAELKAAMGARRRAVYPLKTLLADEALRAYLGGLVGALRASFPRQPLFLLLPSPRLWLAQAAAQALPGEGIEVDDDAVDSAAAYIADFLRAFADCGIDGLLLRESAASEPASDEQLQLYQPVFNVAAHYRWELGAQLPVAAHPPAPGGGFVIAPQPISGRMTGVVVAAGFWGGEAPPPCPPGGFRYAEIPAEAMPEGVLDRLSSLR